MNLGYREVCLAHETGERHPETADRLRAIRDRVGGRQDVAFVSPPDAPESVLRSVHEAEYLAAIETFCADGGGDWDADTTAVEETWDAAVASAGLGAWVAESAMDDASDHPAPFGLCRPPGHHALADDAMGFCFLNNVVVGAETALAAGADRVAVLDWDVHHGNGTQEICYDRGDVFYASIHERGIYPGTGAIDETGTGSGTRCTLNLPFPPGSDTADYLAALDRVVCPSIRAFDPDLVLVSAGFDAHENDPISRMRVTTDGYGTMTRRLSALADSCDAGLGFLLEGGYNLDALAASVETVVDTLGGARPADPSGEVNDGAAAVIDTLVDQGFGSK